MAFDKLGYRRGEPMGSIGNGAGSMKHQHTYVTPDAASVVETAGYFNSNYASFNVGDVITASMGIGATQKLKNYVVTASSAAGVTIALQTTTAG